MYPVDFSYKVKKTLAACNGSALSESSLKDRAAESAENTEGVLWKLKSELSKAAIYQQ